MPDRAFRARHSPPTWHAGTPCLPLSSHPWSSSDPWRAVARVALEEQRLTRDRGYHCRLERLGHQERSFRALAGQETFGIGGNEHHRHLETPQQFVDGVEARRAVSELDIRQ